MQQNENNDFLQNENNQQAIQPQEQEENEQKTQMNEQQYNGNQMNNKSQFTNNKQQEVNKEKSILETTEQGKTQEILNENEQIAKQDQLHLQSQNINQQNSINNQTTSKNNNEIQQEKKQNEQDKQEQIKEQKKQDNKNVENQRSNQKRKTTKRRTTKVEVQENQEQNINQQIDQNDQEKVDQEQNQQQILEQQQKEELAKQQLQEQQEKLQKLQLKTNFLKSIIYPLRTKKIKNKQLNLSLLILSENSKLEQKKCKSAQRYQRDQIQRTKSAINKDLFDFYNKMNPQKPIDQNAMTPNTLQSRKKQQELEQMKKDCQRLEEQQLTQSLAQNKQNTQINNKKRIPTQPKKKLQIFVIKSSKVKVRNGLKHRMLIDKDRDSQLKALEFIKKIQQNRMEAELKRQEQLEKVSHNMLSELENLRKGNQRYKEEQQQQRRKQALEQITQQEKKRYQMMLEQQKNEKFVRKLKENFPISSHYSAKKLALSSPKSLVQELENGQIKIKYNIDTNRKINENQFILKEEQQKLKKESTKDKSKQIDLLHFPQVNIQKNFELVNQNLTAEKNQQLSEIKPKRKKAWQIEEELKLKQYQKSLQFKD